MKSDSVDFDLLFETSWEVCNKVGGIYTVLSTKANTLQKQHKDKTVFIGPDLWNESNPSPFFIESKSWLDNWIKSAQLPSGIKARVGRWNIPGKPIVVLVDYKPLYSIKDSIYSTVWEKYGVDSLHAYGDYDESCMFAVGAAMVICNIIEWKAQPKLTNIAHFDEWTTGMGLLYLKHIRPEVATVFTTHATCIGRSICCNNKPLYDYLNGYNGNQMADELNMQSKHSLEKAAAQNSDCFTTVSNVTAKECRQLLECHPVVTPNGFEQNFVPSKAKYAQARATAREQLLKVGSKLVGYQLPDDALIVATSGRMEFRNKGIDVFIDALNKMRYENKVLAKQIVAFIMVPAWSDGPRVDLKQALETNEELHSDNTVVTHQLHDSSCDSIYNRLESYGVANKSDERVKIIYVPSYLNGDDGIFGIDYYHLLPGIDLTVFPSYYEPWGYTPLESIAFGIPTITTDLSGFGQWIIDIESEGFANSGVKVLHRGDSNYSEVVDEIVDAIETYVGTDSKSIKTFSKKATDTAKLAAWSNFISYYDDAYCKAVSKANKK